MERAEVMQVLRDKAEEMLELSPDDVQEDKSFVDDLHVESLSLVEYTMDLEDALGIELPEEELDDVKTIGAAAVPSAEMRPPLRMNSALPGTVVSPTMRVPGWMVSVWPLGTCTKPLSTYVVSARSVCDASVPVSVRCAGPAAGRVKTTSGENAPTVVPLRAATR